MDPAFCSDLDTRPRQHHRRCPRGLGIGENIALCAESTLGLIPTGMSPDASSIACRRVMQACGCRSYTFHRHAENNSSIAFRKGLQGGRYKSVKWLWLLNQSRTRATWWKLILSQMTTNMGCCGLSCTTACSASRTIMICPVL